MLMSARRQVLCLGLVVLAGEFGGIDPVTGHDSTAARPAPSAAQEVRLASGKAGAAAAKDAAEQRRSLEVVLVTARKVAEPLQSVPESIQALSAREIADAHVTRIDDLGNLVSNLNITTRADQTPDVVLRGIGSFGVTQGVGFYVDGVQLFDGATVRMQDMQRIEVLKGPQGTLYGGSNIGGAIKYVTQLPTDTLQAQATAEYGNYDTRTFSGVLSGPLGSPSLKGRISVYDSATDGYIWNSVLNQDAGSGRDVGGRMTFEYTGDATTAILYLSADNDDTGAANLYYRPQSPTDYSYDVTDGTKPSYRRDLYSATLHLDRQLGDGVQLTSITSYFNSREGVLTDVDKGPLPILAGNQHFQRDVWSEEVHLSGADDRPLTWIAGLYAQGNDPELFTTTHAFVGGKPSPPNLANPANFADQSTDARQRHREYAAFADGTYHLDKWALELGVRTDFNRSSMTDPLYGLSASQSGTQVAPKVSLSYNFTKAAMAYATVSRGFEPGDLEEGFDAAGAPVISQYRPETSMNYEAGFKSTLLGRLKLDLAAFYDTYDNRLFQIYKLESQQFVQVTTNIGSSHNYGAELDASAYVTEHLFVDASFGVTKAIWDQVDVFDPDLGAYTNLAGRTAPYTPAYQGSLWADWSHRLAGDLTFGANLGVTFVGSHYWDVTDHFEQPAYRLVNLGLRLEGPHWRLSAHASNLLNTRYLTAFASAAEIQSPFNVGGIGSPRLWTVAATYIY
jgi:iron complex outermembrane recepter protein